MINDNYNAFLALVRLGLGFYVDKIPKIEEWDGIKAIANAQGLLAVVVDGIEHLQADQRPPQKVLLQWIGQVLRTESRFAAQQKAAYDMAQVFHDNHIRTYVLKGAVISECYPKPNHRDSVDLDCFLLPDEGVFDAWALGNDLMKAQGNRTDVGFYKNSTIYLHGLTVENHQFLTPFRGNKTLRSLESFLQDSIRKDKGDDRFTDTWLFRPPVIVSALFLIEHAYSHFLHEGLMWRHVLDWMMFSSRHKDDIDWSEFDSCIDKYAFRLFYDAFYRLGQYLLGYVAESELTEKEKRMLEDIWAPLDLHETLVGVKGKLGLVGNTLRARWKYRDFAEISMLRALWIQAFGVLFDKHPTLD